MYYPRRKSTRSKRTYRPKRYAGRKARPFKKTSLAARVKKIIHSQIENKVHSAAGTNVAIAYAGSVTNPTYINLCPVLAQGSGHGNRIGTEINVVKANVRGYVNLLPYNSISNPCDVPIFVKMWVCRRKSNNIGDGDLPISSDWNVFFQSGATSGGFTSGMLDIISRPNKEYWTVFATKTFQLSNYAAQNNLATTTLATTLTPMTGAVSIPFSFNFAKHLGKLKYNDASTAPSNKELFLVFQTVRADGTVSSGSYAEFHALQEHEYEDA